MGGVRSFADGNYAINSPYWSSGYDCMGAVTLGSASFRIVGTPQPYNSVLCVGNGSFDSNIAYDVTRHRLLVGRPGYNAASLFTMEIVFSDTFDVP